MLFITGIGLIVYEAAFRAGNERPTLLILFASMIGLPLVFRKDESNGW